MARAQSAIDLAVECYLASRFPLCATRNRIKSQKKCHGPLLTCVICQMPNTNFSGRIEINRSRNSIHDFFSSSSSSSSSWPLCVVYQLLFIQFKLQFILLYFRIMNLFRKWTKNILQQQQRAENGGNLLPSCFFFILFIVVCHFWLARSRLRNGECIPTAVAGLSLVANEIPRNECSEIID